VQISLESNNGHLELTMAEVFSDSLDDVWLAVSTPEKLGMWLPFGVISLEPVPGGSLTVRHPDGTLGSGEITAWITKTEISLRVFADGIGRGPQDNTFRLTLAFDNNETTVMAVQMIPIPHVAPMVAMGWQACFGALRQVLRDEPVKPLAPDVRDFEAYIVQLNLDQPTLEPIPGGLRIRFERQTLLQPVEKFWSVMTAGIPLREGDFAPLTFTSSGESGRISILRPPNELEYLTSDGGRVKWRFHEHFGSARVNLQIAVPRSVDAEALATAWQEHLSAVVARVISAD
jgi:uncharacterized protein YndB with AHSA1/START domain